ncbi:alpha-hydroxy-acid oxidizing protein [Lentibacter sp. XHP0401]|uniref:alpha-hydroxy-acid oxidizing protein n=1 Tax=Lentibacter sp. XHP0401 TaxID=2984334 RepID=UPI0021E9825D|nr:alpha-hydroxy-acid oxidizing protein [Lentibacter sp. XHP0401]MCV2892723.1 alpha-hydroxy-acid oxidizing protein [Lentibacter sp. XHP0401]
MRHPISTHDYRYLARRRLPRMVFDFLEGGAEDENGLIHNQTAFDRWQFLPRRLINVSQRSLQTELFGKHHALPLYLSPTGLNGVLRPGADAMLARAAAAKGIPFALSTASNMSIEEIARAGDGEKWFQLYVMSREVAEVMCRRALDADYDALILTVDVPVNGYRERDMRSRFGVPPSYGPRMLIDGALHPRWSIDLLRNGIPKLANFETLDAPSPELQAALLQRQMDSSFDWDALVALRDIWPKRLIVKGIMRKEDAQRCATLGVDAVILSNHGGRQIDGCAVPVDVLGEVSEAVDIPVLVDSGVRRGSDAIKCLCRGAAMIGIGRAALYAVAARGQLGVEHLLEILIDEMDRTLALVGSRSPSELTPDLLLDAENRDF